MAELGLAALSASSDAPRRSCGVISRADLHRRHGRVSDLIGLIVEATGLEAEVGEVCHIAAGRAAPARARRGRRLPRRPDAAHAARRACTASARADAVTATGRQVRVPGRRRAARPRARRPRPPDRRRPDARARTRARSSASPPDAARAPAHRASASRSACARSTARPVRARPAPGHLRRLRRRQVVAAGHDRPLDVGRRQRHLPRRRARPRGPRVHRARPRRRARQRSVVVVATVRPARARAHQGGAHGDGDRRALPRPGRRRHADDGLGHALRHGPARGRPGHRRAARHARLHAVRLRAAAAAARALGHQPRRLDHRRSTPCSSTATT